MANKISGVVSFDADEVSAEILRELAEIERLQEAANQIQRRVLAYRQLLAAHGFSSFPENNRPPAPDVEAASRSAAERIVESLRGRPFDSLTLADQMVLVLAERGEPMTAREIYAALENRGTRVAGINPVASVLTMLRRDKRVVRRHSHNGLVHAIRGAGDADQPDGAA